MNEHKEHIHSTLKPQNILSQKKKTFYWRKKKWIRRKKSNFLFASHFSSLNETSEQEGFFMYLA